MDDFNKFIKELISYNKDEYIKQMQAGKLDDVVREQIPNFTVSSSTMNRFAGPLQQMKYNYLMGKKNLTCSSFKITRNGTTCIYAQLYSTCDVENMKPYDDSDTELDAHIVKHLYISCSPTFRSQDGEYRHRLIPFEQFLRIHAEYSEEFEAVENMIISCMENRTMSFSVDIFHPSLLTQCQNILPRFHRALEDSINGQRLVITAFILNWICDFHNIYRKIMENHINAAYQYIIYQEEDIHVYESIVDSLGYDNYIALIHNISRLTPVLHRYIIEEHDLTPIECGQKLIPMTIKETLDINDINTDIWRELYMSMNTSDLVLNLICPSFSVINNWFFLGGSNALMYDNLAMHTKYQHAALASEINKELRATDNRNYVNDDSDIVLNNKFQKTSFKINSAIKYTEENLLLSDLTMVITGEYVGRTLRDIPVLIKNDTHVPALRAIFTDYRPFCKHMFEYIYALFCMNTKLGIIHGDLHLNNATIFRLYNIYNDTGETTIERPYLIYWLGDNVDTLKDAPVIRSEAYIFDTNGYFSALIDYSRSVIGTSSLLENDFPKVYIADLLLHQQERLLRVLHHHLPEFATKNGDALQLLIARKYALFFKIISAVDALSIAKHFAAMLEVEEIVHDKRIDIVLTGIITHAEKLLIDNLTTAMSANYEVNDIEWPTLLVMREHFKEFRYNGKLENMGTLTDVFNYKNTLEYSGKSFDTLPPVVSINKTIEIQKKYNLDMSEYGDYYAYLGTDNTVDRDEITKKYGMPHKKFKNDWMIE